MEKKPCSDRSMALICFRPSDNQPLCLGTKCCVAVYVLHRCGFSTYPSQSHRSCHPTQGKLLVLPGHYKGFSAQLCSQPCRTTAYPC